MNRILFTKTCVLILIISLFGCSEKVDKEEYNKLNKEKNRLAKELEDCRNEVNKSTKIIEDLQNTPERRIERAKNYFNKNMFENSLKEYQSIIDDFPNSIQNKLAVDGIKEINKILENQRLAEEKKKTLGFKSLKEQTKIKVGDIEINFKNIKSSDKFIFDWYDDTYHFRKAERGEVYIVASVSISSESKNPSLSPVALYEMVEGELVYIYQMDYRFHRWKDYGSYLGNYNDTGNDFAYSKSINFDLGISITSETFGNRAIFMVVKNDNCVSRQKIDSGRPEIGYYSFNCRMKDILTVDDFDQDYFLVKIFNKSKL